MKWRNKKMITQAQKALFPFYEALAPLSKKSFRVHKVLSVLTSRCNSRCPVCFLWGKEGLNTATPPPYLAQEILPEKWIAFFRQLKVFAPSFILTGGEVMLYQGLSEILEFFLREHLPVHLITNGTLFPENFPELLAGVTSIQISIDGYDQETHRQARPPENLQQKCSFIRELHNFAQKRGAPQIHIGITISKTNALYLKEIVELIQSWHIPLQLTILHQLFTTKENLQSHYAFLKKEAVQPSFFFSGFVDKPGTIPAKPVKAFYAWLLQKKFPSIRKIEWVPHLYLEEIERYYEDPAFVPSRFKQKCVAPWLEVDIMPSGAVFSCPDFYLGNIQEQTFAEMWNSPVALKMRELVQKNGTFPGCRVCASLYEY